MSSMVKVRMEVTPYLSGHDTKIGSLRTVLEVIDILPCTILGSAKKHFKEGDLVVTQPSSKNFGGLKFFLKIDIGNPKITIWKSKTCYALVFIRNK